jgi:hypothetical protein
MSYVIPFTSFIHGRYPSADPDLGGIQQLIPSFLYLFAGSKSRRQPSADPGGILLQLILI